MKTWMKIAMWLGLGGGIGFFAGYQIGQKSMNQAVYNTGYNTGYQARREEMYDKAMRGLKKYAGGEEGEEEARAVIRDCEREAEEAEMPEDIPVIGDEEEVEIPQLHPQDLLPVQITEEEYYANPWGYDAERMLYYEGDQVLYNCNTNTAIEDKSTADETIGIGMIFSFHHNDGEILDAIFVRNDTLGVIFRIDRVDGCYSDPIEALDPVAPDGENEEEEDFSDEDL